MKDEQVIQLINEAYEKNLIELDLSSSQLTHLPLEIAKLTNLRKLDLSGNHLNHLSPDIAKLTNLTELNLSGNHLMQLPSQIIELTDLKKLDLSENPLISPPAAIVSKGVEAIFTYLKQSRTIIHNEAKLILVGNEKVGKTYLANWLIKNEVVINKSFEGTNISELSIPALDSGSDSIKLNIWDFGRKEINCSTHKFFLTKKLGLLTCMECTDNDEL